MIKRKELYIDKTHCSIVMVLCPHWIYLKTRHDLKNTVLSHCDTTVPLKFMAEYYVFNKDIVVHIDMS